MLIHFSQAKSAIDPPMVSLVVDRRREDCEATRLAPLSDQERRELQVLEAAGGSFHLSVRTEGLWFGAVRGDPLGCIYSLFLID